MLNNPSEHSAMNQIHDSGAHRLIISVVFQVSLDRKVLHYDDSIYHCNDFGHIRADQED